MYSTPFMVPPPWSISWCWTRKKPPSIHSKDSRPPSSSPVPKSLPVIFQAPTSGSSVLSEGSGVGIWFCGFSVMSPPDGHASVVGQADARYAGRVPGAASSFGAEERLDAGPAAPHDQAGDDEQHGLDHRRAAENDRVRAGRADQQADE